MPKQPGGYVYFVQAPINGLIKIGHTSASCRNRFSAHRSSSPVPLVVLGVYAGPPEYESRIHRIFRAYRDHGEWFRPEPKLLQFIAKYVEPYNPAITEPFLEDRIFAEARRWEQQVRLPAGTIDIKTAKQIMGLPKNDQINHIMRIKLLHLRSKRQLAGIK